MRVRASRGYGPEPPPPLCAFNEVHPLVFSSPDAACRRPGRGPAAARGGDTPATPVPGGPVPLDAGADAQGQDGAHQGIGLKGAALAPIGRNSGKSVLPGCDLRPLTFTGPTRFPTPAGNPAVRPVQGCGPSAFAGGPDVETAVRTTGLLTAGRNPWDSTDAVRQLCRARRSVGPVDAEGGPTRAADPPRRNRNSGVTARPRQPPESTRTPGG